jgi:drug/metabolite transporter (DMT)-like permease
MFLSPGRTGAGIASVLGNLQPLVALVLAKVFLGERLTASRVAALILGLSGATLIAYPALAGPSRFGFAGPLLALLVSVGSALGSVLFKRLGNKGEYLTIAAWQLLLGALPLVIASFLMEPVKQITWTAQFAGILLFLALMGTALVTGAWYWLLQRHDVGSVTLFLFLTPLFGLAIAILVFAEKVGFLEIAGVVLTLAGVGVISLRKDKR